MAPCLARTLCVVAAASVYTAGCAGAARADDTVRLILKDHRFSPEQVIVPAGRRFRIEVSNQDSTPAEFESSDLRVEKIVVSNGTIVVNAGPLRPGTYRFFDDYHPDQAKGTLTAVERQAD
jgi:hypothetical protein